MRWKPVRLIPDDTKYPFMRLSRFGFFVSGVLCAIAIALFVFKGLNYGIDFKGGSEIQVRSSEALKLDDLRTRLDSLGVGKVELQQIGKGNDVLIKVAAQAGDAEGQKTQKKILDELGPSFEKRSANTVGGTVSSEYTQNATGAVMLSILFVLFYLSMRFEWQFALGAVLSLLHDVTLSIGLFSLIGLEFNLSIVAAILTIIGYSLNDTVVVFDRIREFLRRYKSMGLADLIDFSINSVLPRTMLTSAATMMALLALFFFGGDVIHGFAFAMIWGVVVGTYSSIFIAAPVLILLGTKREKGSSEKVPAARR
jgi:preprotein translocase subunit SecF